MSMGGNPPSSPSDPRTAGDSALRAVRDAAAGSAFQRPTAGLEALGLTPRQTEVLGTAAAGQAQQADCARAQPVRRDRERPRRCGAEGVNVSSRTQAVLAVGQMSQAPGGLGAWRGQRN